MLWGLPPPLAGSSTRVTPFIPRRLRPHRPPRVSRGVGQPALRGGVHQRPLHGACTGVCLWRALRGAAWVQLMQSKTRATRALLSPRLDEPRLCPRHYSRPQDVKYAVYQLSYDSVHGRFPGTVAEGDGAWCGMARVRPWRRVGAGGVRGCTAWRGICRAPLHASRACIPKTLPQRSLETVRRSPPSQVS